MEGVLEPIHDLSAVIDREASVRDGWAGDVACDDEAERRGQDETSRALDRVVGCSGSAR